VLRLDRFNDGPLFPSSVNNKWAAAVLTISFDSSVSVQRLLAASCECSHELLVSIKDVEFLA
jgi:hypothetical protein